MNETNFISVVIPVNNEARNVSILYDSLVSVFGEKKFLYEIIFVDDGSTDDTYKRVRELCRQDPGVVLIKLSSNFGQSAALSAGFEYATADIIVTMDGDLQHDAHDIPVLVEKIHAGYDIASGWRKNRIDNFFARRIPSFLANIIIKNVFGIRIHDFGTTLKAYRSDLVKDLELYGDLHRFIPALLSNRSPKIAEVPINNTLRKFGRSHYSIRRFWPVLLDLFIVKFLTKFIYRPFHLFGAIGLIVFSIGFAISLILTFGYYFAGVKISDNLGNLILSVLLMIVGFQLIATGLSLELISRIYHSSHKKKNFSVKEIIRKEDIC